MNAALAARAMLSRHSFDGLLVEGVALARVAAEFGTPCWVYGAGTLRARYRRLAASLPGVDLHYAVKALDHLAILALLRAEGAGADVVSGGELARVLCAGIAPDRVVFSGVGKTRPELDRAITAGVGQINAESFEELDMISGAAVAAGRVAPVALRINPDVAADTHDKIATGRAGDKFGIAHGEALAACVHAAGLPGVRLAGFAVHIGSQIFSTAAFRAAYARVAGLVRGARGAGFAVDVVDCGGGLGIAYGGEPEMLPEAWGGAIRAELGGLGVRLIAEPGRWLVGPAGILLASVVLTKRRGMDRPVVVLDAAMNDLARPAMYGATHEIVPVAAADLVAGTQACDIVGPVCESGDVFARDRAMPELAPGALVAILDAGAYGAVMSSTYNARPLAACAMVDGEALHLIRPRQAEDALWAGEMVP